MSLIPCRTTAWSSVKRILMAMGLGPRLGWTGNAHGDGLQFVLVPAWAQRLAPCGRSLAWLSPQETSSRATVARIHWQSLATSETGSRRRTVIEEEWNQQVGNNLPRTRKSPPSPRSRRQRKRFGAGQPYG